MKLLSKSLHPHSQDLKGRMDRPKPVYLRLWLSSMSSMVCCLENSLKIIHETREWLYAKIEITAVSDRSLLLWNRFLSSVNSRIFQTRKRLFSKLLSDLSFPSFVEETKWIFTRNVPSDRFRFKFRSPRPFWTEFEWKMIGGKMANLSPVLKCFQ
jgi:hypothetical protein